MDEPKHKKIRFIVYSIAMILFFMIQQTPIMKANGYAVNPNILIPIVLSIAFFEGEVPSMVFGILAGILMDFGAGVPLLLNTLLFAVVCFFASFVTSNLIRINVLNIWLLSLIVIPVIYGVNFLFFYVMKGYGDISYVIQYNYLPRMLTTFILVPIFYFFTKSIVINIREKE